MRAEFVQHGFDARLAAAPASASPSREADLLHFWARFFENLGGFVLPQGQREDRGSVTYRHRDSPPPTHSFIRACHDFRILPRHVAAWPSLASKPCWLP